MLMFYSQNITLFVLKMTLGSKYFGFYDKSSWVYIKTAGIERRPGPLVYRHRLSIRVVPMPPVCICTL